jgi:hypothetical protein
LASELITDLTQVDKKIKAANKELTELVEATGSGLQDLRWHRPVRRRPPDRRRRRHQPVLHPRALRVLERHRTAGRILR